MSKERKPMRTINYQQQAITPSKLICVGRNYAKHIAELNNTATGDLVIFIKPNSAISHTLRAYHQEPLHYEGEISLMIKDGEFCAVGFGLDLTKRDLQNQLKAKQLPWERAKSFDGAAVLGEFVPLDHTIDIARLSLELWINDELRQKGGVADMLFSPTCVLNDLKTFISLEDGDILMTGTPDGVGQIHSGDRFVGRIYHGDALLLEEQWLAS